MKQNPFGRHLSSQIIWPLILVSVLIGIVATVVSARVLGDLTRSMGEEGARSAARDVIVDLGHHSRSYMGEMESLARRQDLADFAAVDDREGLQSFLAGYIDGMDVDAVVAIDPAGGLAAMATRDGRRRDVVLPEPSSWTDAQIDSMPVIVPYGQGYALWLQADVASAGVKDWVLGGLLEIDSELIRSHAARERSGILVLDDRSRPVAMVGSSGQAVSGDGAFSEPDFKEAIDRLIVDPSSSVVYRASTGYFQMAAGTIPLGTGTGDRLLVVTGVDASRARDATFTTVRFVVVWSVVAILVLIGLNWWVVRSVTTPLSVLTASTARLAEGDFATRVDITGPSEITELADNFNRMTDSLSERSESLTKKVLELATLYEMSRSLGLTLDLRTLLDSVLESALRIFEAEVGYIIMLDRESGALSLEAARGIDPARSEEAIIGNSMSEWVIHEGRPLIFNPSGLDDGQERQPESFSGAQAALCVPLQTADGPIGSVTIGTRDHERRFTSDDVRLLSTIANHVTIAIGNIGLFSNVQEAYLATVRALAAAVDAKDPYTRGHSEGVATYALMTGEELGLSQEQMTALEMAAYLHDIGKIGISEDILLKPGKLTDVEMGQMRHHPLIGANILKPVAFPWPIAPVVRHHHEHFDGQGYPAGLRTDEIPVLARVLTVADAFEAMVADRPYRRGRSHQEAILELERCAGTQFDPRIVEAFVIALEAREGVPRDLSDHEVSIGDDEAQAVFIAIADGLFSSFRRLGGPRLANNLESSVNTELARKDMPFALEGGRLVLRATPELSDEEYARHLKDALGILRVRIEEASGAGLAEHFLGEAVEALPERMRAHAERLGFTATI